MFVTDSASSLARLNRRWRLIAGIDGLAVIAGFFGLQRGIGDTALLPDRARQWALWAALLLAVELIVLRRNLHKNRPGVGRPLYAHLGWGTGVTLARGIALGWMAGFLLAPRPGGLLDWAPAVLYTAAIVADYFDGYLARRTGHTTLLGEALDIEFDGLGIMAAMALAVQYGQLPGVILLVAIGRPLFLWGMKLRQRRGLTNHPLPASDERRIVAGLLMGSMAVILWPVFPTPATHLAGAVFGGAVAASFLRDWLVVIGWLDPASPVYIDWRRRLRMLLFERLPLLLRLASLPAVGLLLWRILRAPGPWAVLPSLSVPLFAALGLLAAVAALLGVIARLAAIGMITLACADLIVRGDSPQTLALLAVAVLLVVLGNGSPALWTPDERLLRRRAGSRPQARAKTDKPA